MGDTPQRRPWTKGPVEDAPSTSWLSLDDDALLHRIETLGPGEDEDDRLVEIVASERHFFIRQEAAKRVKERRRLFPFEDDRYIGQVFVRHLSRREDISYLERISMLSHHVEVRQAAQVQLARVWRRLEQSPQRDTRPFPKASVPPPAGGPAPAKDGPQAGGPPVPVASASTSAPLEGDEVDGSLLGWAAHFLVEQAWNHLGTKATLELLRESRDRLTPAHPTLALFEVGEDARVTLDLDSGPRIPRTAVRDVAMWMAVFRKAARAVVPEAGAGSVLGGTALMADALRAAGFYVAFDDAEAALSV
jgi:hypothetical protein